MKRKLKNRVLLLGAFLICSTFESTVLHDHAFAAPSKNLHEKLEARRGLPHQSDRLLIDGVGRRRSSNKTIKFAANQFAENFGWVAPGSVQSKTFTVLQQGGSSSNGTVTLVGSSSLTLSGDTCSNRTLAPGQSCLITVTFAPLNAVRATAVVTIPSASPITITYSGMSGPFNPPQQPLACGSQIDIASQALLERLQLPEVPYALVYSSRYGQGYVTDAPRPNVHFFGVNNFNISNQHFLDVSNKRLYLGTGQVLYDVVSTPLPNNDLRVVSSDGSELFIFDNTGKHRQTRSTLANALKYEFTYNTFNLNDPDPVTLLTAISDAYGRATLLQRAKHELNVRLTFPSGQIAWLRNDLSNGKISAFELPNALSYTFSYKANTGLMDAFTKPGGQISSFEYDADGYLIKDTGNGGDFWSLTRNQSQTSLVITKTSRESRTGTLAVSYSGGAKYKQDYTSSYGQLSTLEDLDNAGARFSIPGFTVTQTKLSDGRFRLGYLRPRNLTRTFDGVTDRGVIFNDYPTPSNPDPFSYTKLNSSVADYFGSTQRSTNSEYVASTRTLVQTTPLGRTRTFIFDQNERIISAQKGSNEATVLTYNSSGMLASIKEGTRPQLGLTYDQFGYLSEVQNQRGEKLKLTNSGMGLTTKVALPDLREILYTHDDNGKVRTVTPPSGQAHQFNYNSSELISSYEPPTVAGMLNKNTNFIYNGDKQLIRVERPNGLNLELTYTSGGLLASRSMGFGADSWIYQSNSDLASQATSSDGVVSNYTFSGREPESESQTLNGGAAKVGVKLTFDAQRRVTERSIVNAANQVLSTIAFTYDRDDKLQSAGDLILQRDPASGRLLFTWVNGIRGGYSYNSFGEITGYTVINMSNPSQIIYSYSLGRDVAGRISTKTERILNSINVYEYSYDSSGRLTAIKKNSTAGFSSYVYDPNSNKLSGTIAGQVFSASYDAQDRIQSMGTTSYLHNDNGDLISVQAGSQALNLQFDAASQLKAASSPGGINKTYSYDVVGRVAATYSNGVLQDRLLYQDGLRIAAELTPSGSILKEYVYGTGDAGPDYISQNGIKYFVAKDYLGSPMVVINSMTGAIVQQLGYNEHGKVLADSNPGFQKYGFAGGIYDSQTKLLKLGARWYLPDTGRFVSKDPLFFDGGDTNLYAYAFNDPINFIDPSGLYVEVIAWQPSGYGRSSFGHLSANVNGTSYSFGSSGMDINPFPVYRGKNNFRHGVGVILDLTPKQELAFETAIRNHQGDYDAFFNNCTDPILSGLRRAGVEVDNLYGLNFGSTLFPSNIGEILLDVPQFSGVNFYAPSVKSDGVLAPWAK